MKSKWMIRLFAFVLGISVFAIAGFPLKLSATNPSWKSASATKQAQLELDVPYVPTPEVVVTKMLEMANVGANDIVYDLGCGDGRITIAAVRDFKAKRGVGIDLNPDRIREANSNAKAAGVSDRVEFRQQNLFDANFSEASVVTLYLLSDVNLKLRPQLLSQLKPGSRIVSHAFDMGDWKPEQTEIVQESNGSTSTIYKWTVPEK
jgi:ribosomal protein L11 methylase PrmA